MDFTTLFKTVAPWIGTALGGPLGGMAVEAVASAFGLGDKTTDAIKTAIGGATPEQMLALKNADQTFALQMQELGFKQVNDLRMGMMVIVTDGATDGINRRLHGFQYLFGGAI